MWVPLAIYVVSRAISTVFMLLSARHQDALTFTTPIKVTHALPSSPSLLEVATNWDGQWYWAIVDDGYPTALPPSGSDILQSPIAFYPGYPTLVHGAMTVTGASFPLAAVALSVVLGGVAVIMLHRLLLRGVSPFAAAANITLLCVWPASPVMQVAYTESLALLMIVVSIGGLMNQKYLLAGVGAVGLGLVRPLTVPLACVVLVHAYSRWRSEEGNFDRFERLKAGGVLLCCVVGAGVWPAIAAWRTSDPLAYFHAMDAWAPGDRWGGWFGILAEDGQWFLLVLVALMLAGFLYSLRPRPTGRTWPLEIRTWSGAYILFVLASSIPSIGIARYALLMLVPFWPFPDDTNPEQPKDLWARRAALATLVVMSLAAQYWWVSTVFVIDESPLLQSYP
jgi:hypothetical protein